MLLLVGDDRAGILLAARTRSRDDDTHRHASRRHLVLRVLVVVEILLKRGLCRHGIAAVRNAAAADCQDEINFMFPYKTSTLLHLAVRRITHDARKLRDFLALFLEDGQDFIIDAIALDAAAAIGQQDMPAVLRQLLGERFMRCPLPKVVLCRI